MVTEVKETHQGHLNRAEYFKLDPPSGLHVLPVSAGAPSGWGKPFKDAEGNPINPPLGTVGGASPLCTLYKGSSGEWRVRRGQNDPSGGWYRAVSADNKVNVHFTSIFGSSRIYYRGRAIPPSLYEVSGRQNRVSLVYVHKDATGQKWLHIALLTARTEGQYFVHRLVIKRGKLSASASTSFTTLGQSEEYVHSPNGEALLDGFSQNYLYLQSNCNPSGTVGYVYDSIFGLNWSTAVDALTGRFRVNLITGGIEPLYNVGEDSVWRADATGQRPFLEFADTNAEAITELVYNASAPTCSYPVGSELEYVIWRGFDGSTEIRASYVMLVATYSVAFANMVEGSPGFLTESHDYTGWLRLTGMEDLELFRRVSSASLEARSRRWIGTESVSGTYRTFDEHGVQTGEAFVTYYPGEGVYVGDPAATSALGTLIGRSEESDDTLLPSDQSGSISDEERKRVLVGFDPLSQTVVLYERNGYTDSTFYGTMEQVAGTATWYLDGNDPPRHEFHNQNEDTLTYYFHRRYGAGNTTRLSYGYSAGEPPVVEKVVVRSPHLESPLEYLYTDRMLGWVEYFTQDIGAYTGTGYTLFPGNTTIGYPLEGKDLGCYVERKTVSGSDYQIYSQTVDVHTLLELPAGAYFRNKPVFV